MLAVLFWDTASATCWTGGSVAGAGVWQSSWSGTRRVPVGGPFAGGTPGLLDTISEDAKDELLHPTVLHFTLYRL